MQSLFLRGRARTCSPVESPSPIRRFVLTGALAIVAASVGAVGGKLSSIAVLGDAVHGLVDGGSEFLAAILLWRLGRDTRSAAKPLAIAMLLAAGYAGYEAIARAQLESYPFSARTAFLVSCVVLVVDCSRLWLILPVSLTPIGDAVYRHIKSDTLHTLFVWIIAGGMMLADHQGRDLPVKWMDLGFAAFLVGYMAFQAKKIWQGQGCHDPRHKHG